MAEHHVSVTVNAPIHQVYTLFTHFNDFPKFMSFVKEVTYYDDQRSHWVVNVAGTHEWDAVNEAWIPNQQVGWRSTSGIENSGVVKFTPLGPVSTLVDVYITYKPPVGVLGAAVEQLNYGQFDEILQRDMKHFARMVEQAPSGALDPMQSHYLFHDDSAVSKGEATERQQAAMKQDPMMSTGALQERATTIEREVAKERETIQTQEQEQERLAASQQQASQEQEEALRRQAELDREAAQAQEDARSAEAAQPREYHPVYDTIGGRNASMDRTALGDLDSRSERFPGHHQDPMTSRAPVNPQKQTGPSLAETEIESPWRVAIHGQTPGSKKGGPIQVPGEAHKQEQEQAEDES